jgi:hypothetical protein
MAAKLLLRLRNAGDLRWEVDHEIVYTVEKRSDELALSAFDRMPILPDTVTKFLGHPRSPRVHHLRAVAPATNWRWTPLADENALVSREFGDLLAGARDDAYAVSEDIVTALAETRGRAGYPEFQIIPELIAAFAAAKCCLSIWGDEQKAALIETIAEQASARQYQALREIQQEAGES